MSQSAILDPLVCAPETGEPARIVGAVLSSKGPNPLRPSRLEMLVRLRLQSSGYRSLTGVVCHSQGKSVVLIGRVPSYHMKQLAQEFARRVDGVQRVYNRLIVCA